MSSKEKLFGAAAISWTRRATCAANAPTNPTNSNQKATIAIRTIHAEPAELAEKTVALRVLRVLRETRSSLYGGDDRGHDLEQVADNAVVGDLEDRGVGVFVDRDDRVRTLHADEMLDGARDAERHVEL